MSFFALQIAQTLGATVVATTSISEKTDRLTKLGATAVVNHRDHPDWSKPVRAATNEEGVHRLVEVGGPATIRQSLASLARRSGEIALIGFAGGGSTAIDFWEGTRTAARGSFLLMTTPVAGSPAPTCTN
ncbi:hypothetical protein Kisp01_70950 [Kineosporia sp. NBRC 101677]|uniref:zinc-binding dehydrogenase n=1 Tax=Kineosporia sp. NBRC 101677 TaxID=3032197 RepID=UPI0024A075A3|nr:zinc-binding dehydrogenase [Kineosporia sp. NBRC 101677]GLY20081.1 hypothetical protein Kisp01_70950 [Kineosporia sp. NBRC 101677]